MPNYKKIFSDLIEMKYPYKKKECTPILNKVKLSQFDVLKLSNIISENQIEANNRFNQRHKSYNHESIQEILKYQEEYNLNDTETALYFKMSRNTLKKWKALNLVN